MIDPKKVLSLGAALSPFSFAQPETMKFVETLAASAAGAFAGRSGTYASFLVEGPPGSGMVNTALRVAGELGLPAAVVTMTPEDDVMTPMIGIDGQTITSLMARHQDGVLVVSDVDKAGPRDAGTLRGILNGAAGKGINSGDWIVIMTTNEPGAVDPDLASSVDEIVHFRAPPMRP